LTGLNTRGALHAALDSAAAAYERVGQPAALLLLDLDQFKQVNDEHGHGVGDELLRSVGAAIRSCCRPYDTPARFGGDEFAVLYTQTESDGAEHAAQRLMAALRGIEPPDGCATLRTRASGGLIFAAPGGTTFRTAELMKLADEALYEAKRAGGDRLVVRQRKSRA
jgi:diguanylate cyclase (GGDEF)-like protein